MQFAFAKAGVYFFIWFIGLTLLYSCGVVSEEEATFTAEGFAAIAAISGFMAMFEFFMTWYIELYEEKERAQSNNGKTENKE